MFGALGAIPWCVSCGVAFLVCAAPWVGACYVGYVMVGRWSCCRFLCMLTACGRLVVGLAVILDRFIRGHAYGLIRFGSGRGMHCDAAG